MVTSIARSLPQGTLDPLYARVVVLEAEGKRLALVTLDLGRVFGPASLAGLRERLAKTSGISLLLITASHTHSGPNILDEYPSHRPPSWEAADLDKIAARCCRGLRTPYGSAVRNGIRARLHRLQPPPRVSRRHGEHVLDESRQGPDFPGRSHGLGAAHRFGSGQAARGAGELRLPPGRLRPGQSRVFRRLCGRDGADRRGSSGRALRCASSCKAGTATSTPITPRPL